VPSFSYFPPTFCMYLVFPQSVLQVSFISFFQIWQLQLIRWWILITTRPAVGSHVRSVWRSSECELVRSAEPSLECALSMSTSVNAVYLTTGRKTWYENVKLAMGMIRGRHWSDTHTHTHIYKHNRWFQNCGSRTLGEPKWDSQAKIVTANVLCADTILGGN
jgi:hypothetical protein